ncbi:uncharacterized protein LOC131672044 [Phymastichus coffea]|uniref:uncharacterized protein LOC131672044 n=1 Tax=Phymastichus coffea TaxID=108790 RepID=UPI00273B2C47|nr:uncharacterized protein LOC131672044 [Phymastichus coffea]
MVVDEDHELNKESLARVKLISHKKRQLEETADHVRNNIKGCFERLAQALKGREKQLLRQVEAIHRQQLSLVQSNLELLPALSSDLEAKLDNEQELIERLLNFGKIELANSIAVNDSEPYKAEEYLETSEDVVSFDKSLKTEKYNEIDVTSVIRRKRDSSGNHTKNITINLNCTSCETCKLETDAVPPAVAGPSRLIVDRPATPTSASSGTSTSNSVQQSPLKGNMVFVEIKSPTCSENSVNPQTPSTSEKYSENIFFEFETKNANIEPSVQQNGNTESNVSKSSEVKSNDNNLDKAFDNNKIEHSIQIQQWLQKILTETETEPIIHEIGQFSSIPNSRLYREFPVET